MLKYVVTEEVEGAVTPGGASSSRDALEACFRAFFQMHQAFYRSLFALAHTPRCLQHLCRCAIRKSFGRKCFSLVPLLPLPESLQNYLLLEPEGVLH